MQVIFIFALVVKLLNRFFLSIVEASLFVGCSKIIWKSVLGSREDLWYWLEKKS